MCATVLHSTDYKLLMCTTTRQQPASDPPTTRQQPANNFLVNYQAKPQPPPLTMSFQFHALKEFARIYQER